MVCAQYQYFETGGGAKAMAGITAVQSDGFAPFNNAAWLAEIKQPEGGIFIDNKFLLKELSLRTVVFGVPFTKTSGMGAGFYQWGFSSFKQSSATVSYGLKLAEKLYAGVKLNYFSLTLADIYGSAATFYGSAGLVAKVSEKIAFAAQMENLTRTRIIDKYGERLTSVIKIGAYYKFSSVLNLMTEVCKTHIDPISIRIGFQYSVIENLQIMAGYRTQPHLYAAGILYRWKQLKAGIAMDYHATLGVSPSLSLSYSIEKKTRNAPQ